MGTADGGEPTTDTAQQAARSANLGLALALGALAVVGAGIAFQQMLDRRLTRPEKARLRFYKYLREKGHLES